MAMMIDDEHVLTTAEDARDAGAVAEELRRPNPAFHAENLPPRTMELILRVLDATAKGGALIVAPLPEELTTSTAAKILGISRPTLMKMIREGRIPAHEVGTHHRLRTQDVLTELRRRRERRRAAFAELLELEGDEI